MSNNVTIALSESSVQSLFNDLRDQMHFTKSGSSNGNFRASYNAGVRFEGGRIDFQDSPDRITIRELDVVYDPLNVELEIDIPEICVGGFCILPNPTPWGPRCLVRAPRICIFEDDPDIRIPLNLDGIIESEISGGFTAEIKHFDNPAGAGLNKYEAYDQDKQDAWNVHLGVDWLDLDIIDIADTVGNTLDRIIDNFIDGVFGGLPGWAKDILSWLLHGISDIIRGILDVVDDFGEWLSDLLGVSFGLFDFILEKVGDFLGSIFPVYQIPTPYAILPGDQPVLLPIKSLSTDITNNELILQAEV